MNFLLHVEHGSSSLTAGGQQTNRQSRKYTSANSAVRDSGCALLAAKSVVFPENAKEA
jgi:hypothetical protein